MADDVAVDGAAEEEEVGIGGGGEGRGVGVVVGGYGGVIHEGVEFEGLEGESVEEVGDEESVVERSWDWVREGVEEAAGEVEVVGLAEVAEAGTEGNGL